MSIWESSECLATLIDLMLVASILGRSVVELVFLLLTVFYRYSAALSAPVLALGSLPLGGNNSLNGFYSCTPMLAASADKSSYTMVGNRVTSIFKT